MKYVTSYVPTNGGTQPVSLLLQTGITEIINDSNYALIIQTNTGQCFLAPNMAQIYPTPAQGGSFNIQAIQSTLSGPAPTSVIWDNYYNIDVGPVNVITVNQYLQDELIGINYPIFLQREMVTSAAPASQITATGSSTLSAGLTLTTGGLGNKVNGQPLTPYFVGVDLSLDSESTAHGYTLTISGLYSDGVTFLGSIAYVGHSSTTSGQQFQYRPPYSLQGVDQNTAIQATIPAVSGGTARISMTLYVIGK